MMGRPDQQWDLVPVPSPIYQLEPGRTLRDVAAVVFRRRRIILVLFVSILATAAAGVVWLRPRIDPTRYLSQLKFIVRRDRVDAVVTPSERSVPGLPTAVSPQEVFAEIELLKSADVLERLAREARVPLERLQQGLAVELVSSGRNTTNLIAVRYSSTDRAEVARVLDRLPEVHLEKYLSMNRRPAALEYFRSQAEAYEQELRQAEEELADFHKQQPSLAVEGSQPRVGQRLTELERQRVQTEASLREAESRAVELERQLQAVPAAVTQVREVEESPYLARLKSQLLELENRRAQATWYREIQQLEIRISQARQTIASETRERVEESVANPARAPLEAEAARNQVALAGLRARRTALAEQERVCREQLAAARLINAENSVELADLTRKVKATEDNFLLYRKKYAEAREAELLDRSRVLNVSLAEGPRPPAPVGKRSLWFYLALGMVVAVTGATAGGFAADLLDHSVHTPRELETRCALAVLACVPESRQG